MLQAIDRFTSPRPCPNNMRRLPGEHIPVVFCGDFNSLPTSGVISLLSTGHLPYDHLELEVVSLVFLYLC